jgi:pimeloyl-ACP methyl ester carboxylesterase
MLLLHQCNSTRKSWEKFAKELAKNGVHVLAFDYRGYGESSHPGNFNNMADDIDAALAALMEQKGVDAGHIAVGGASCGVENAVRLARRNASIRVLVLLSGPTTKGSIEYLQNRPAFAIFAASSAAEGPMAVDSLTSVVATSKNPSSKLRVLPDAGHGAPMFEADPTLLLEAVEWVESALRK